MGNTPTPLRHAIRTDDLDFARHLLQKAGENSSDVINQDHSPDCVMESCSRVEGNALYYAVDRNRTEIVKLLLEYGGDIHTTGHFGETCLHNTARNNSVEIADVLVKAGCSVYTTDDQGRYPIHSTGLSLFNTTSMMKYLLEEVGKKEDINLKDYHERTPLHEAALTQNTDVIRTMIAFGAEVNAQSKEGNTPLHSVKKGTATWDLLISSGADVNIQNNNGLLPGELVT